jgi:hypothetical protein
VPSPRSWLLVCDEFARANGLPRELFELLFCFRAADPRGGPPPPPEPTVAGDFVVLERARLGEDLLTQVDPALAEDVDPEQAALFGRRVAGVDRALAELGDDPGARLLRVGLRQRLRGILAGPRPRAVRVRALADFYASQLGWVRWRGPGAGPSPSPSVTEQVAALTWSELAAGLEHGRIAGPSASGPVHIELLRVDPAQIRIEVHRCHGPFAGGHGFAERCVELGALAGISGGFFLDSEPDIAAPSARFDPVGLLLDEGEVVSPPVFRRPALALAEDGVVTLERLGLDAASLSIHGARGAWPVDGQQAWNRARGQIGPGADSVAVVGDRVVAVGRNLAIPVNGFVVPVPAAAGVAIGDAVRYAPMLGQRGVELRAAIAGGPTLLERGCAVLDFEREEFWGSAPPVTFSQDETGDRNLLPRLGLGLDDGGRLLVAAVDGRDLDRALGMRLAELGDLLRALGCHTAINLDGGASKRMVVGGREVGLAAADVQGDERPVATGVLFLP